MRCPGTVRRSSTKVLRGLFLVYCLLLVAVSLLWWNVSDVTTSTEHSSNMTSIEAALVQSHDQWKQGVYTACSINLTPESLLQCIQRRTKLSQPSHFISDISYVSVSQHDTRGSVDFKRDGDYRMHSDTKQVIVFGTAEHEVPSFRTIYAYFDRVLSDARVLSSKYPNALLIWDSPAVVQTSLHMWDEREVTELQVLLDFLTLRHVVQGMGILVTSLPKSQHHGKLHDTNDVLIRWQVAHILEHLTASKLITVSDGGASLFSAVVQHQHIRTATSPTSLHTRCAPLLCTRRFHPDCHPPQTLKYPLLITGLGGAGTHFVAKRLSAEGWRVRHEEIGADGAVSWFYAANDHAVGMEYPYGALSSRRSGYLSPRFAHVIHLVREPAAQISSFTAHSNKTYDFVLRTMELVLQESPTLQSARAIEQFTQARTEQHKCVRGESCHLHFAALTWMHWNRFVESFTDVTFRVGQVEDIVQYVCTFAGREGSGLTDSARYCEIANCPGMARLRPEPQGIFSNALRAAYALPNTLFGACQLNERLFRRSANHKNHRQYTLEHVRQLDPQLAGDIESLAVKYGFFPGT